MSGEPVPTEKEELASPAKSEKRSFSWLHPHPIFVIILVGPLEQPFGMQKDFLCHKSAYYREYFAVQGKLPTDDQVELVVKLPDVSRETFGLAQHFMYTSQVIADGKEPPTYDVLVNLWNLGRKLHIDGLCDATLQAMKDCRRLTGRIPASPLLVQVWRDTSEGASVRELLLSWAAEYMRSSETRAEFAKSLPQEVLSELVVKMSSSEALAAVPTAAKTQQQQQQSLSLTGADGHLEDVRAPTRKSVHYLDDSPERNGNGDMLGRLQKSRRTSAPNGITVPIAGGKSTAARRLSLPKPHKRRSAASVLDGRTFSTARKLEFCSDLLTRMLSGPGFWTRLVGPFRTPVDPAIDGVPDYLNKVKRPMDLSTIKAKMDQNGYPDEAAFLADVRQIFDNCFTYWKRGDPMYEAGQKLQRTFEEKFSHMNKWIVRAERDEEDNRD